MFLAIFSWLYSHLPSDLRAAGERIVEALRRITNRVSGLWNILGRSLGRWYTTLASFRDAVLTFAASVADAVGWLKSVAIPRAVKALQAQLTQWVNGLIAGARALAVKLVDALERVIRAALNALARALDALRTIALSRLASLKATLDQLIKALGIVLRGPEAIAEWIAGAMWRATLRLLYANRDRALNWLLRGSPAFARWVAGVVEDMIVRLL